MACVFRTRAAFFSRKFYTSSVARSNAPSVSKAFGIFGNIKASPKTFMAAVTGLALGVTGGGGYAYYRSQKAEKQLMAGVQYVNPPGVLNSLPNVPVSRQVIVPGDVTGLKLTLFQYPTCPFCCKVRAFLNYFGISYNVIEVDPVLRQQTAWTTYRKVPILLVEVEGGYQQMFDSSMIISSLASYLKNRSADIRNLADSYPIMKYFESGKERTEVANRYYLMGESSAVAKEDAPRAKEERKWRRWADDVLVHVLSPNVYRTRKEALDSFNWFSEVGEWDRLFPTWERAVIVYVGAYAMWIIGKRLKSRHNLKNDVRLSLYDACDQWVQELRKLKTEFHGGNKPDLADLAVYGVLSSIEGCLAFKDLLQNTDIGRWYYAVKSKVDSHAGIADIV